jgi:RNA polymerase-associated protein CTR9
MAGSVYIPVQNSEEEVCVALDQLPRDAADILDILKAEQAPLDLWLIIAVRITLSFF